MEEKSKRRKEEEQRKTGGENAERRGEGCGVKEKEGALCQG
jgi:hypothetical protein